MTRALKMSDQVTNTNFTVDMPESTNTSPNFLHQVCSDKVTSTELKTGTTAYFGELKIHMSHVSWWQGPPKWTRGLA
jgi:hypothetical protein